MFINIVKYGMSEGLAKIAPFLTTMYVAKYLSPELFGKYSLLVVSFEIIFIFISFNVQATTRIDYFKEPHLEFFNIKQNHLVISILIASSVGVVCVFFLEQEFKFAFLLLILSALLRTITVLMLAIFQCSRDVNAYIYSNISFVLVLSLSTFVFVNLGASYFSWIYALLIASALQLILVMKIFGSKEAISLLWPRAVTLESIKKTFIPAALFMPQAIGWWLKSGADRVLINKYLGTGVLGNYSLAFQIASVLILIMSTINLALVPFINENLKNKNIDYVLKILLFMPLGCIFFAICIYFFGIEVLNIFYSDSYALARNLFLFLCLSQLFQAVSMIYVNILYFENEGKFVAKVIFLGFLTQVIINFNLLYLFKKGVIEMIFSSIFFNMLVLFVMLKRVRKVIVRLRGLHV